MTPAAAQLRELLRTKEPGAEDMFRRALTSEDEEVRSIAARGLFELGASDAVDALLRTIDDAPDMLHADVTPSVNALGSLGLSVLPRVLPLLNAAERATRQHAQRVLERAGFREIEEELRPRPLSQEARRAWTELWERNGSYDWDAPPEARQRSIELWKAWVAARERR
jgi:HEAT repeat protein